MTVAPARLIIRERGGGHDELRAGLYEPLMSPLERLVFGELRTRVLSGLRGRGVEVGIGTGLSLPHYPRGVELIGVEPLPAMARIARAKSAATPPLTLVPGCAEALPFADSSFDFAVGQFMLCSVDDPARALSEMHRVLRPGGEVRLVEHVRSSARWLAGLQDRLAPSWSHVAYGCRLNGAIEPIVSASRFRDVRIDRLYAGTLLLVRGMS